MGRVLSLCVFALFNTYTIIKSSESFENYRLREPTNLSFVEEQKSRKVIYINVDTFSENRTDNLLSLIDYLYIRSLIKYILYDGMTKFYRTTLSEK